VKAGPSEQPVFATGPKSQADFGGILAGLKPEPGKRIVNSSGLRCFCHITLDASAVFGG
jgi:hypothetical protein